MLGSIRRQQRVFGEPQPASAQRIHLNHTADILCNRRANPFSESNLRSQDYFNKHLMTRQQRPWDSGEQQRLSLWHNHSCVGVGPNPATKAVWSQPPLANVDDAETSAASGESVPNAQGEFRGCGRVAKSAGPIQKVARRSWLIFYVNSLCRIPVRPRTPATPSRAGVRRREHGAGGVRR